MFNKMKRIFSTFMHGIKRWTVNDFISIMMMIIIMLNIMENIEYFIRCNDSHFV